MKKRKIHPVFNTVLSAMLIGAVPMLIFVGGGLGINILIWNICTSFHITS